jgi:hypothetical protein
MIEIAFFRVHHDQVERLRGWLRELTRRADETRATFAQEGVRHERAYRRCCICCEQTRAARLAS